MSMNKHSKSTDVTKVNPFDFVYIKGNESTDGSIRISISTDGLGGKPELKTDGVWNASTWEVAGATLLVGLDLRLSAAGDWLEISDSDGDVNALTPHIEFTDAGGTVQSAHLPILTPLFVKNVFQPVFDTEIVTNNFTTVSTGNLSALVSKTYYKPGSISATAPLQLSVYKGTDNTGPLFFRQNIPTATFAKSPTSTVTNDGGDALFTSVSNTLIIGDTADHSQFTEASYNGSHTVTFVSGDTYKVGLSYVSDDSGLLTRELEIVFDGKLGAEPGSLFTELTSDENFSILGNSSGASWLANDFAILTEEDLMTSTTGMDRVLIDQTAHVVADITGDLILNGNPPN